MPICPTKSLRRPKILGALPSRKLGGEKSGLRSKHTVNFGYTLLLTGSQKSQLGLKETRGQPARVHQKRDGPTESISSRWILPLVVDGTGVRRLLLSAMP